MTSSPIDEYLDQLLVRLASGRPRDARHLLAETEAHLRDTTDELVAGGMAVPDAEAEAVRRFGPVTEVASAERRRQETPLITIVRQCVASGLLLGGIGAIAVGVSGAVAGVMGVIGGNRFLIDVRPGQILPASSCASWLAGDPGAHYCAQAAVADWASEVVYFRIAAGILGVLAILAYRHLRKRWALLPRIVVDTVAAASFAVAGVWMAGLGVDAIIYSSGYGSGQWLSAAPIALLMAIIFGLRLIGDLRHGEGIVGLAAATVDA